MTQTDARLAAFLSDRTEVFHTVQHRHEIWRRDPFDVETVHAEARAAFERLLVRATTPPGLDSGRILLLLGDSGCGKTHLLRAFRTLVHERSLGFVGYMQMTTSTANYGRYVLSNLIDSLDQPYCEPTESGSALEKLSGALLARCGRVAALLREPESEAEDIPVLVDAAADDLIVLPGFARLDLDLLRALLFLQRDDPRIKSRVLKYLRCENLSDGDRKVLGGLVPRVHDDDPQRMVEQLGRLMAALGQTLVLCVDQLEDIHHLEKGQMPLARNAMQTLCALADRVPSSLVVLSCLHNLWTDLRQQLINSMLDRIERDPDFIKLETNLRTADDARRIAERRLEHLYSVEDAPFDPAEPTYPLPHEGFEQLVGLSARAAVNECRRWREEAIRAQKLPERFPLEDAQRVPTSSNAESPPPGLELDQAWNDFRSAYGKAPPEEDSELAELLVWALRAGMDEVDTGHRVDVRGEGEVVLVDISPGEARLRVSLCNKGPQRGALAKQIEQARKEARGRAPVVVRTSAFPSSANSTAAVEMGKLLGKGGRRAVLEDSDCRAVMALREFRQLHQSRPDFAAWLRLASPLTQLKPIRDILDLDHLRSQARPALEAPHPTVMDTAPRARQPVAEPALPPPLPVRRSAIEAFASARTRPVQEVLPVRPALISPPTPVPSASTRVQPSAPSATASVRPPRTLEPLRLGELDGLLREPVLMRPNELTQHAAFLGGSGSGKTTAALNVVEQLLLQGVPAILVDRKGDLAGYATESFRTRPLEDPRRSERRALLRERVDVALFTPGHPHGRALAIPIVPDGLSTLQDFDRQQATRHAADALAGMLDYRQSPRDRSCRTILAQAIDQFVQLSPESVTLERLVRFIDDRDPRLVNAVGRLDTKLFDKLAEDLDRLRIDAAALMGSGAEKLDMDLLLGRGAHALPGKTRLSVISTKHLGETNNVLFWVTQLLIEVTRWMSRNPSSELQAVVFFDEADMYLPATRQPSTKQPMENLLKRARSAGLGVMLVTQSPGDFDYKCRDTIRSWFVGRVKEKNSLDKMKPMLSDAKVDFSSKIPNQSTGEFHIVREGKVDRVKMEPSALATEQLPDDELLRLAASTFSASVRHTGS